MPIRPSTTPAAAVAIHQLRCDSARRSWARSRTTKAPAQTAVPTMAVATPSTSSGSIGLGTSLRLVRHSCCVAEREESWRLFCAVELPDEVRHLIERAVQPVSLPSGARRVPPEQWHVTLAFYSAVVVERVPTLRQRLRHRLATLQPLPVRCAGSGRFDGRVLWVGADSAAGELATVATQCRRSGAVVDVAPDESAFRGHVSVARSRSRVDFRPAAQQLSSFATPSWTVTDVALVRSHLGAHVRYEVVEHFPLGSP